MGNNSAYAGDGRETAHSNSPVLEPWLPRRPQETARRRHLSSRDSPARAHPSAPLTAPSRSSTRRHVHAVYRYALAVLHNEADAEDVTQTTFLSAYRAFQRGERPHRPHNWLIKIAHNVCRQRFRDSSRRPQEVEFDESLAAATTHDDDVPTAGEIRHALGFLAFNQRAALVMRELEGRSYAEIAQVLDLSVGAVETLIFRARRALREQLEGGLTCEEAELTLSRLEEQRLSSSERGALRAHLRECKDCAVLERRSAPSAPRSRTSAPFRFPRRSPAPSSAAAPSAAVSLSAGWGSARRSRPSSPPGSSRPASAARPCRRCRRATRRRRGSRPHSSTTPAFSSVSLITRPSRRAAPISHRAAAKEPRVPSRQPLRRAPRSRMHGIAAGRVATGLAERSGNQTRVGSSGFAAPAGTTVTAAGDPGAADAAGCRSRCRRPSAAVRCRRSRAAGAGASGPPLPPPPPLPRSRNSPPQETPAQASS